MLVVYTFYQSISLTIPKTTYLKFVDYWLIFCLLVPFVIFLIETYWYLDENKKSTHGTQTGVEKASSSKNRQKLDNASFRTRRAVRFLVPILTVACSCVYMILAIKICN